MKSKHNIIPILLLFVTANISFATFQSISISTITAEATVTGGTVGMSIEIRKRSDNTPASSLTWTVLAGTTQWALADQYIVIHATLTQSGSGIRIYTDNAAPDANPKFGGTFGENNGAGLISLSMNTAWLPLGWLVKDELGDPPTGDPNTFQSWFYFKDKSQTNFWSNTDTKDYSTVAKAGYGFHYAQGPQNYASMPSPNYIYIQANFQNAVGGWNYKTTTLRVELFTE